MRWIAISLLVTNIILLIAQLTVFSNPEPVVAAHAPQQSAVSSGEHSLRLLNELSAESVQGMKATRPAKTRSEVPRSDSSAHALCTLVGPFDVTLRAEYLVERLAALDVSATIEQLELPGDLGYWVYLPPRETRRQAFDELRELQAKGIDSYVIPRGDLANGVSFGMFSRADLAKSRLEDMRARGYAAELREAPRMYRETWVVVAPGQEVQYLDAASWQELLQGDANLERRQNFCPPVASEQNFH